MTHLSTALGGPKSHGQTLATHSPALPPARPNGAGADFGAALDPAPQGSFREDTGFRSMDSDHNGLLTRDELARDGWGQTLLDDMDMLDRNGDGMLSLGEMAAARHTRPAPRATDTDQLLWALRRSVETADGLIDAARGDG